MPIFVHFNFALAAYGISSTPTPCVVFEATPPITGIAISSSETDPYRVKLFWSDESKIYHKEFTLPRHRASGCPDQGESKTMSIHCDVECKLVCLKLNMKKHFQQKSSQTESPFPTTNSSGWTDRCSNDRKSVLDKAARLRSRSSIASSKV
jgi:hypothetical protein